MRKIPEGYLTINKMALWLNKDRSTVKKIITEASIPPERIGSYDYFKLSVVVDCMVDGERLDLQQERAKLAQKQTEKTRIQIAQMKGELIDADQVQAEWTKYVSSCRAKLLAIPTKLAGDCLSKSTLTEVKDVLNAGIKEALAELAEG